MLLTVLGLVGVVAALPQYSYDNPWVTPSTPDFGTQPRPRPFSPGNPWDPYNTPSTPDPYYTPSTPDFDTPFSPIIPEPRYRPRPRPSPYGGLGGQSPYGGLGGQSDTYDTPSTPSIPEPRPRPRPFGLGGQSPYGGLGGQSPYGGLGGQSDPYDTPSTPSIPEPRPRSSSGLGSFFGGLIGNFGPWGRGS